MFYTPKPRSSKAPMPNDVIPGHTQSPVFFPDSPELQCPVSGRNGADEPQGGPANYEPSASDSGQGALKGRGCATATGGEGSGSGFRASSVAQAKAQSSLNQYSQYRGHRSMFSLSCIITFIMVAVTTNYQAQKRSRSSRSSSSSRETNNEK